MKPSFHKVYGRSAHWYATGIQEPLNLLAAMETLYGIVKTRELERQYCYDPGRDDLTVYQELYKADFIASAERPSLPFGQQVQEWIREASEIRARAFEAQDHTRESLNHGICLSAEVPDSRQNTACKKFSELTGCGYERSDGDERPAKKYWTPAQARNYLKVVGLYEFLPECYK